jgi:hypothetical protein
VGPFTRGRQQHEEGAHSVVSPAFPRPSSYCVGDSGKVLREKWRSHAYPDSRHLRASDALPRPRPKQDNAVHSPPCGASRRLSRW